MLDYIRNLPNVTDVTAGSIGV